MGVSLFPAISQPQKGQLYGWLPLSNAYGISSGEKQPISFILRLFLALENKAHSMYIRIFLHHKTKYIQCTYDFTCITKQYILNVYTLFLALQNKNTSNVHTILLASQNNTQPMYIPFTCITKYTLKTAGISSDGKTKYA